MSKFTKRFSFKCYLHIQADTFLLISEIISIILWGLFKSLKEDVCLNIIYIYILKIEMLESLKVVWHILLYKMCDIYLHLAKAKYPLLFGTNLTYYDNNPV